MTTTFVEVNTKDFFYGILELTKDFSKSEELLQIAIAKYEKQFKKKISSRKAKDDLRHYATEQLRDNMEAAGRNAPERTSPHHVVAYGHSRAIAAMQILAQVGIHINDEVNGVHLPINRSDTPHPAMPDAYPHKPVHTKVYFLNVEAELRRAYKKGNRDPASQKKEVENKLREIAEELTLGVYPLDEEIIA